MTSGFGKGKAMKGLGKAGKVSGGVGAGQKTVSRSAQAGLMFPVGRIHRQMKEGNYAQRIGVGGAIYLSAVLEYLTSEVLEIAGDHAKASKKQRVTPQHIMHAIKKDEELDQIAGRVTFPGSGVLPQGESMMSSSASNNVASQPRKAGTGQKTPRPSSSDKNKKPAASGYPDEEE